MKTLIALLITSIALFADAIITPDGIDSLYYVPPPIESAPQMQIDPNGGYHVGDYTITPQGSYVTGDTFILAPNGEYIGSGN